MNGGRTGPGKPPRLRSSAPQGFSLDQQGKSHWELLVHSALPGVWLPRDTPPPALPGRLDILRNAVLPQGWMPSWHSGVPQAWLMLVHTTPEQPHPVNVCPPCLELVGVILGAISGKNSGEDTVILVSAPGWFLPLSQILLTLIWCKGWSHAWL